MYSPRLLCAECMIDLSNNIFFNIKQYFAKFAESEVEHKVEIDKLKEELSHIQLNLYLARIMMIAF